MTRFQRRSENYKNQMEMKNNSNKLRFKCMNVTTFRYQQWENSELEEKAEGKERSIDKMIENAMWKVERVRDGLMTSSNTMNVEFQKSRDKSK